MKSLFELFLFIMFMSTTSTYSNETYVKGVRERTVVEPSYRFNHPPTIEHYKSIPVQVVYENNNDSSGKSGSTPVNDADDSFKQMSKAKLAEPRYYANHPPSAESYSPIDVTVVYEDNNKYSGKSKTVTKTKENDSDENVKVSVIDNVKYDETVTKQKENYTNTPTISSTNDTNVKLVAKEQVSNNLEVPVAVVYESDFNSYRNHQKRKTDNRNQESPKSHLSYSRKIETGVNRQQEQTTQIPKEETEKSQPKIDTRVFKKRTGGRDPVVPILEMESYVFSHRGNFHYKYESGDGTKAYSEGKLITIGDEAGESVVGGFSYKDKEGNDFSLTYTADENGFQPVGAHLPTPPPTPPAIARALEYLATATPEPSTKRPNKSKALVR